MDLPFFDRNGKPATMKQWLQEFQSPHMFAKETNKHGFKVLTVWRGIDAAVQKNTVVNYSKWEPNEVPQIFESILFDPDSEIVVHQRYATIEEAYAGHAELAESIN